MINMGSYVQESDVRNFFTPALDYDDISKYEIDIKIEAVEDFVKATYFNDESPSASDVRIPCLLLVASKIICKPELAKTYHTINSERLGDYAYTLGGADKGDPHEIAVSWERMALMMLRQRTSLKKYYMVRAND